jgi:hypothetical protein
LKDIKGWRKISHEGGYLNEITGQTLVISKKQYSQTFHAIIYVAEPTKEVDGKIISPEFGTFDKAETYATDLMRKHPCGII